MRFMTKSYRTDLLSHSTRSGIDFPTQSRFKRVLGQRLSKEIKWPSPQASLKFKLLISKNLTLLSGRTIGEINGDSICLKYNGNSVINYIGVYAYSFTG